MSVSSEKVLVVPTSLFHSLGHFQGFTSDVSRYFPTLIASKHVLFRPRAEVESDPDYKQLIPYMIFSYTDNEGNLTVFQYVRGKGMGEQRLHSKRSIGVGGHISQEDFVEKNSDYSDATLKFPELGASSHATQGDLLGRSIPPIPAPVYDLYRAGMLRELQEEVELRSPYKETCVGMINDDETEVGRVHLGVVHRFELERPELTSRETDLIESGFVPVEKLLLDLSGFETWSAISLAALFRRPG